MMFEEKKISPNETARTLFILTKKNISENTT